MIVRDLGLVSYGEALDIQRRTVNAVHDGSCEETLYLLEHPHVITLGRNASAGSLVAGAELLRRRGVERVETDRGGDVTYHGPGQLVGYPILALEEGRRDIRRFVRELEESLILTLRDFGLDGRRDAVHRGVWVEDRKIASVGIRISRWVTSHGFALNVSTDLDYFNLIHPCGIVGCPMTSLEKEIGHGAKMAEVKESFVRHFARVFGRTLDTVPRIEEAHA